MFEKNYQLIYDDNETLVCIYETNTGYIPIDESNKDYVEYLASLEPTDSETE